MGEKASLKAVSYHAVTRYVQRVLGVVLPIAEVDVGSKPCAEKHCAAADTTIQAVRGVILSRDVAAALVVGKSLVTLDDGVRVVMRDGIVTTVVEPKAPIKQRPARILSRAELRKRANRNHRRHRHAGSVATS